MYSIYNEDFSNQYILETFDNRLTIIKNPQAFDLELCSIEVKRPIQVRKFFISSNEQYIVILTYTTTYVISTLKLETGCAYLAMPYAVTGSFSPNGLYLALLTRDAMMLYHCDPQTMKINNKSTSTLSPAVQHGDIAFSMDSTIIYFGWNLWFCSYNIQTQVETRVEQRFPIPPNGVGSLQAIAVSPNGGQVAVLFHVKQNYFRQSIVYADITKPPTPQNVLTTQLLEISSIFYANDNNIFLVNPTAWLKKWNPAEDLMTKSHLIASFFPPSPSELFIQESYDISWNVSRTFFKVIRYRHDHWTRQSRSVTYDLLEVDLIFMDDIKKLSSTRI